ncbi:unnamed protein product [Acanthoscelides obtectus]|uniref:MADF domain-containing protein n=1 Tax=Acanthoscelides obtectus TaxID=200917 RepID=A0A9P0M329_ACAOB|nr:unnamed protein product [Acanthoscelides obtectus]CAK1643653.1 hypothetical protein AOBTE_LOCUS13621 [Acanthoscelides obtectus]
MASPPSVNEQKAMKWDKESTLKLIEMYEAHPELWNCILKEYRDRDKKAQAIKNIADQLKTTEAEVEEKWHNLRCQMNSEIRKIKKTKSGDGTDDRLWKSKFSGGVSITKHRKTNNINTTTHRSKKLKTKAKEKTDEEGDAMLEKAKNILNTPTDEYTVFGEYVASELRQLRSDERKRRLKRIIQKAIVAMSEEDEVEFSG